jgi:predicted metalloendopeptidase
MEVTYKEFTDYKCLTDGRLICLEENIKEIKAQVTNHLPHQIEQFKKDLIEKIDENTNSNHLYNDNKITSYTRDVLDKKYIDRDEFNPIKNIVYGVAGATGLSIVAAVVALILK